MHGLMFGAYYLVFQNRAQAILVVNQFIQSKIIGQQPVDSFVQKCCFFIGQDVVVRNISFEPKDKINVRPTGMLIKSELLPDTLIEMHELYLFRFLVHIQRAAVDRIIALAKR